MRENGINKFKSKYRIDDNKFKNICLVFMTIIISLVIMSSCASAKIDKLNKTVEENNQKIVLLNKENIELKNQLEINGELIKNKDDKIIELESRMMGLEIPKIDSSKKTFMDYRSLKKDSKQGGIVYSSQCWCDEDGLWRLNNRILL